MGSGLTASRLRRCGSPDEAQLLAGARVYALEFRAHIVRVLSYTQRKATIMQVNVTIMPDEPIVIMEYVGHPKDGIDRSQTDALDAFLLEVEQDYYFVVDVRRLSTEFMDVVSMLKLFQTQEDIPEKQSRRLAMPPVFVGGGAVVDIYIQKVLPKYFGVNDTPVFKDLDEALAFVRLENARRSKSA